MTKGTLKAHQNLQTAKKEKEDRLFTEASRMRKINDKTLVSRQSGAGHIFGSVTTRDLDKIKAYKVQVDKRKVFISETQGTRTHLKVQLHYARASCTVNVEIRAEESGRLDQNSNFPRSLETEELLKRQVGAMFAFLASVYGAEKLVLKAGRLDALAGMRSKDLPQQVMALQKVVFEDPTIRPPEALEAIPAILEECQEAIADKIARQGVEQDIEERVSRRMQEKHEEYIRDIRREVISPKTAAPRRKRPRRS